MTYSNIKSEKIDFCRHHHPTTPYNFQRSDLETLQYFDLETQNKMAGRSKIALKVFHATSLIKYYQI